MLHFLRVLATERYVGRTEQRASIGRRERERERERDRGERERVYKNNKIL